MSKWKLKRLKQCDKCPWKVSTDPFDIPNGYDPETHAELKSTIAVEGSLQGPGKAMSCHEHSDSEKVHCVGWINHQLGAGNNIALRMQMMSCDNIMSMKVVGDQHQSLEETLPQNKPVTILKTR